VPRRRLLGRQLGRVRLVRPLEEGLLQTANLVRCRSLAAANTPGKFWQSIFIFKNQFLLKNQFSTKFAQCHYAFQGKAVGFRAPLYSRVMIQRSLFRAGCFVQQHAWLVIISVLTLFTLCSLGLRYVHIETDIVKLWVSGSKMAVFASITYKIVKRAAASTRSSNFWSICNNNTAPITPRIWLIISAILSRRIRIRGCNRFRRMRRQPLPTRFSFPHRLVPI
jgi:hypothetical protein